ncbi:MAG: hypothetical protein ABIY50_10140 [Ignavibacteria bacterium]
MTYEIRTTEKFERQAKRLTKKFPSLKNELAQLGENLSEDPIQGTSLGKSFFKIRLAIKSKGKGKSGGARVITYLIFNKLKMGKVDRIYMTAIYDKSEFESISNKDLEQIISDIKF